MAITISQLRAAIGMDDAQFQSAVKRVMGGMDKMASKAERAGKSLALSVTAPLIALGGTAVKIAADYEQSMDILQATTRASGEQMAGLGDLAKQLGSDIDLPGASAADAGLAMTELAKGGLSVKDTMDAARPTLQLAAAAMIDNSRAAEIVAETLSTFSLQGNQAARVADLLAGAADAATGTIDDMASAMAQSGASFQNLGVNVNDAATSIALMAKQGIKGQDAGTSLKSAMIGLSKPTAEAAKKMKELKLSFFDAHGQFVGLRSVADQLKEKLGGLSEKQRAQNLVTLAGTDGQRGLNALMKAGGDGFDKMSKAVGRQGAAASAAAARNKGLKGAIDAIKSSFETAAQAAVEPFIADLTKLARSVGDTIGKFGELSPETRKVILGFLAAAAATGPVLIGIGKLIGGINGLKAAFTSVKAAGGIVAFLGGPVPAVILGVIAVIALLAAAWATDFGHIREVTFDTFNTIITAAEIFGKGLSETWEGITDIITGSWEEGWDKIKEGTSTAFHSLSEGAKKAAEERVRIDKLAADEKVKLAKDSAKKINLANRVPDKDPARVGGGGTEPTEADIEKTKQLTSFKERLAQTLIRLRSARRGETQAAQELAATFPLVAKGMRDNLALKEVELEKINATKESQKRYREELTAVNGAIRAMKDGTSVTLAELAKQYPGVSKAQLQFLVNQQQVRKALEEQTAKAKALKDALRSARVQWLEAGATNDLAAEAAKRFGEEMLKTHPIISDAEEVLARLTPEQRAAAAEFAEIGRKARIDAQLASVTKGLAAARKEFHALNFVTREQRLAFQMFSESIKDNGIDPLTQLTQAQRDQVAAQSRLNDKMLASSVVAGIADDEWNNLITTAASLPSIFGDAETSLDLLKHGTELENFAWQKFHVILKDLPKDMQEVIKNLMQVEKAAQAFNQLRSDFMGIFTDAFSSLREGFGGFFSSILTGVDQFLTQIASKFLAARLTELLFSLLPGGMDFLGSVIAGGTPGSRGIGGTGEAGRPQIVGDRGPELFVPSSRGRFISNRDMQSGAGGGQIVQNIHIHATDAQSVIQSRSSVAQAMFQAGQLASRRNGG